MLSRQESGTLSPPERPARRSFSHNIRSSLDNASSRLSLSSRGGRQSRRSISGPRSVSATGDRDDREAFDDVASMFATYSFAAPTSKKIAEAAPLASIDTNFDDMARLHDTHEVDARDGVMMREESCTSMSSTHSRWYRRFSKTGSSHRLSKAMDTAEALHTQSTTTGKLFNPFSRRRSTPVLPQVKRSILGQTPSEAVETGGHANNASRALPTDIFPLAPVEVPYVMDACMAWLMENHAHWTPGIFRINGSSQAVKTILDHFSGGSVRKPLEEIDLPGKQMMSVHDVASCLKKVLVLLPGGLLGPTVFQRLRDLAATTTTRTTTTEEDRDAVPREILATLAAGLEETDPWKYNTLLVLLAFLHYIDRQSAALAREDDPKQETGFMNAFSLGIVFSPTCLGCSSSPSFSSSISTPPVVGAVEMSRSATSASDRSETTSIEEAVAVARQGAKVVQMLIQEWGSVASLLAASQGGLALQEDDVSLLDVPQSRTTAREELVTRELHTILDSPIKARSVAVTAHERSESVDTVTMRSVGREGTTRSSGSGSGSSSGGNRLIYDARLDILQAKLEQAERERDDALRHLRQHEEENAKLFARTLALERELAKYTL